MLGFTYYNPSEEKRSCVVRTLTKLSGKQYAEVKQELEQLADKTGFQSYNEEAVFEQYLRRFGFHKIETAPDVQVGALELEAGMYCVFCTNQQGFYHLLPLIDGVIYDRRDDSRGLTVLAVYQKKAEK